MRRFTLPRHRFSLTMRLAVFAFCASPVAAQDSANQATVEDTPWRYTLRNPGEGWPLPDFNDSGWQQGSGGFGTRETPGARVGTVWQSNNIWLRKSVDLASIPAKPALLIHHDEDTEVFINGTQVAALKRWTTDYIVHPLGVQQSSALKVGANSLAVHCRQNTGGQFIDVHIIDAANDVPRLPKPVRNTSPFNSALITKWGRDVTADNAWTEYPRPALVRKGWQNLNGRWDYAITSADQTAAPELWDGKILVPFCLESKLGGVGRLLDETEALWYRRAFQTSPAAGKRTRLNFEAVDYRCAVFVNGQAVGEHVGGSDPFSFDITSTLRDGSNNLVVRVQDATEGWQLRGKQVLNARGIWYTQVSGIWQTVWLEEVASTYLADVKITTKPGSTITVRPIIAGDRAETTLVITVKDGDTQVAKTHGPDGSYVLPILFAKLWSPSKPHLYDVTVSLLNAEGQTIDTVETYAGIRAAGKQRDKNGHLRFTLNGKPIFHWGPLDQGWWPDGLLTPPSDEAMLSDIAYLKAAGFNMIRKHIKVEPRRYYYHCDRLGMLVWQDQVSGGTNPAWTRLKANPQDADWPDARHQQFMLEFERMIDSLENHPCIVVWTPFNEAWGQHRTMEVGRWAIERDPTRLINIASGGNFWPVGDIVDAHQYPHPGFPWDGDRYRDFVKVVGEFGGHGYPVKDHLWDANRRNWGYGGLPKDEAEYVARYQESIKLLGELKSQGIAAGVYTQTTDVEGEINGLISYDRKVIKIPAERLNQIQQAAKLVD